MLIKLNEVKLKSEYEALIPRPSKTDNDNLKNNISERGIEQPLILNQNNILLDGYTRYYIANDLNIAEIPIEKKRFNNETEERLYILSINSCRRHLTMKQRSELAVKYKGLLEKIKREKSQVNLKQNKDRPVNNIWSVMPAGQSREIAGKKFGVSGVIVDKTQKILENLNQPELKLMWDGNASISKCYKKLYSVPEAETKEYHNFPCVHCKKQTQILCPITKKKLKLITTKQGDNISYRVLHDGD